MTPTFIRVWGILGEGTYLRHPRQGLTCTHLLQKWPVPFLLALVKYPAFGCYLVPWLWVCMSVQLRWSWSPWPSGLAPIANGVRLILVPGKPRSGERTCRPDPGALNKLLLLHRSQFPEVLEHWCPQSQLPECPSRTPFLAGWNLPVSAEFECFHQVETLYQAYQVLECLRGGSGFVGCYYDSTLGRTSVTTVMWEWNTLFLI